MSSQAKKFNLPDLVSKFEESAERVEQYGQLNVLKFAECMREVACLFDGLGGGFAFASSDLQEKMSALDIYGMSHDSVMALLRDDVQNNNVPPKDKVPKQHTKACKCSGSRALNRCAFVCKFITELFRELRRDPNLSMKDALQIAYTPTMAKYHVWAVRTIVQGSFGMCAGRKDFLKSLSITEEEISGDLGEKLMRFSDIVTQHIEEQFEEKQVPWIF